MQLRLRETWREQEALCIVSTTIEMLRSDAGVPGASAACSSFDGFATGRLQLFREDDRNEAAESMRGQSAVVSGLINVLRLLFTLASCQAIQEKTIKCHSFIYHS